jgi:hypothetical protein
VIEQHPEPGYRGPVYRFAIYADIVGRKRARPEGNDGAVDADPAGSDPLLDLAPRAEARGGEDLLDPLSRRCR